MFIEEKAYEAYKLDWMRSHELTLMDFLKEIEEYRRGREGEQDISTESLVKEWELESGFHGECYVCYEEFLENEYLMRDYMVEMLPNPKDREEYLIKNGFFSSADLSMDEEEITDRPSQSTLPSSDEVMNDILYDKEREDTFSDAVSRMQVILQEVPVPALNVFETIYMDGFRKALPNARADRNFIHENMNKIMMADASAICDVFRMAKISEQKTMDILCLRSPACRISDNPGCYAKNIFRSAIHLLEFKRNRNTDGRGTR